MHAAIKVDNATAIDITMEKSVRIVITDTTGQIQDVAALLVNFIRKVTRIAQVCQ